MLSTKIEPPISWISLVRDRHTETGTAVLFCDSGVLLLEWVEDPLDELRIHSLSGIMDPEQEFHAVFIPHHLAECHADLAFFRELRGVGEEVYEDLGDPLLIADHIADVHVLHFHDIGDSLFLNCLLKQVPDLVCQVVEVEWLIFKLDLTDLNPGPYREFC